MNNSPLKWIFTLAGALLLLFILLPLAAAFFSTTPEALANAVGDPELRQSLVLTFSASAIATGLTLIGGLPLAYLLARTRFRGKRIVESLVDLPVVIPHTAAGIALLLVFGSQGVIGKTLAPLGIDFIDSLWGIVAAMAFVSLPYLVSLSREAFAGVDPALEQASLVDGASSWQTFTRVTLPIAWRGVVSGILMMWARGISEFGSVVILAYHPKIVPVLLFERFQGFGLNAAQPVAVLMVAVVLVIFILLRTVLITGREDN